MTEARVVYQIALPADIHQVLNEMAAEIDGSVADVFINAIALLNVALESKREGSRLVLISGRDGSQRDVVGFDTVASVET